jgi:multiple sugar transport system permease protein
LRRRPRGVGAPSGGRCPSWRPPRFFVVVFLLLPVGYNVWLSFTKWQRFAGWDEFAGRRELYVRLAGNPFFGQGARPTR